jgi:hypothetical protein
VDAVDTVEGRGHSNRASRENGHGNNPGGNRGKDSGERRNSARRKCSYCGLNRHTEESGRKYWYTQNAECSKRTAEQSKELGIRNDP